MEKSKEELKDRITVLETELVKLRDQVDFFVAPLALAVFTNAHSAAPIPPIMNWIRGRFFAAMTLDEKRVLKANFDRLKNEIPMERSVLVDLPEVKEQAVDMSIFEK